MSGGLDIWASLPGPALVIDADDCVLDVNAAAEGFLNSAAKTVMGRDIWALLGADAPLKPAFHRARDTGAPLLVRDIRLCGHADCAVQVAPVVGQAGAMLMLITPRELARENGARGAVHSAIGMAEMLAHEIKNPLAGITGAAQLLAMETGTGELTDLIVEESRRIVKLLDQVEQFGNLSPPDLVPVNLHDVLDRARQSALLGYAAGVEIKEDYDPSLPFALADADQLLQVILNLLKNACEAMDGRGTITLRSFYDHTFRLRQPDDTARALPLQIEITDTGPGLPEDIPIFDPFVSGRENGTGLGLALASKIITDHGGWITATSQPGHTTFRLSLPRAG